MGIYDLYCKICNGPFYTPNELDDVEEDMNPKDPRFMNLFGWVNKNVVVYPDGRIIQVQPYITNEGATTLDGVSLHPGLDPNVSFTSLKKNYWNGLAIHMKCLILAQLYDQNSKMIPNHYNRLFFDFTYDGNGNCRNPDDPTCDYSEQYFDWLNIVGTDDQYLVEDPDLNMRNRDRIVDRGLYIRNLPITEIVMGPVQINLRGKLINVPTKYMVEGILSESDEFILQMAQILQVSPTRYGVLRILKDLRLLVGPYIDLIDHPRFSELSDLPIHELDRLSSHGYALTLPKSVAIKSILSE